MGLGSIRVRLCHEIHARPADHERPGHGFTGLSDKPEMSPEISVRRMLSSILLWLMLRTLRHQ